MTILLLWLLVMVVARSLERSWLSPGALLALVFGISAFGTAGFAPEYYESLEANLYLQLLVLLVSIGVIIGKSFPGDAQRLSAPVAVRPVSFMLAGYSSAIASFVITLRVLGVSARDLLDVSGLMSAAQDATRARYVDGLDFPTVYNLSNSILIAYSCAAIIYMVGTRRFSLRMSLPAVIFIGTNLLITTRSPVLVLGIAVALTGVYARKIFSESNSFPRLTTRRSWLIVAGATAALLALFFTFQVLRFGEESTRTTDEVWAHLRRWPWGSLPGFSMWWDGLAPAERSTHTPGFYTFMGIFDNLGIEDRVVGGYEGYVALTPGELGNIYTAFRGVILDFGFGGAILFSLVFGVVGGVSVAGRVFSPLVSLCLYVAIAGFAVYGFVVSYWAFTSNLIGIALIPALYYLLCGPRRPRVTTEKRILT